MLQLEPEQFWQISRSAIVQVSAIDAVKRVDSGLSLRMRHLMNGCRYRMPISINS